MGMTELVLDTELDPEQREYLNLAKMSADSLLSLINDILDYSKIEAGKLEIDAIDFNLGDSLGDTMKTLSFRAHQKGLELAFEIGPDVPDALVGDPGVCDRSSSIWWAMPSSSPNRARWCCTWKWNRGRSKRFGSISSLPTPASVSPPKNKRQFSRLSTKRMGR
jgi:signal transduction histidine kinase